MRVAARGLWLEIIAFSGLAGAMSVTPFAWSAKARLSVEVRPPGSFADSSLSSKGGAGSRASRVGTWVGAVVLLMPLLAGASGNVHTTWLWHLHQPIYWPDRRVSGTDHYEAAWDTIQQQNAGRAHPSPEVLANIFGLDDRKAAYQYRPHDTLASVFGYANAGAQVSFSGALMENVQSLGTAGATGLWRKLVQLQSTGARLDDERRQAADGPGEFHLPPWAGAAAER